MKNRNKIYKTEKLFDVISSLQFDLSSLSNLFNLTDAIRKTAARKQGLDFLQKILSDKRAVLYFAQPSTRTFLSFSNACQILGINISDIRLTATSSESKGESTDDTIRTMASYSDLLIIRHYDELLYPRTQNFLKKTGQRIPIINAGLGMIEHPTQALLDIYTLSREFKGKINGKRIVIVGDLKRGRTIHSLIYFFKLYPKIKLIFISPKELKINADNRKYLKLNRIEFEESTDLNSALSYADVLYMTRIQDEYDRNSESKKINYDKFILNSKNLKLLKDDAIILHPLPRRNEINPEIDSDSRAKYWEQEENGMWIRAALIATIFKADKKILSYKS